MIDNAYELSALIAICITVMVSTGLFTNAVIEAYQSKSDMYIDPIAERIGEITSDEDLNKHQKQSLIEKAIEKGFPEKEENGHHSNNA